MTEDNYAKQAIRDLLADGTTNGIEPGSLGRWAEDYSALVDAHQVGGIDAVRKVFGTLAKVKPELAWLVGTEPEAPKTSWTVAELYQTEFPEPRWAVPGILPVGLSFLAGRPKLGKSWLALQIAHAVGTGGKVFGIDVDAGSVLFLALEDSPRRLKERTKKQGVPGNAGITFHTEWAALPEGGIDALASGIQEHGYSLVIVDTLSRAVGRADQLDLADMTVMLGGLQRLAHVLDVAILVIDHHRKSGPMGPNPIDDIMGSTGKAAVTDTAMGLYKEQGKRGAVLSVTGRDIDERSLALEWDGLTWSWQCLGDADDVRKDTVKGDILAAIDELVTMGETPTTANIADHTGQKRPNISRALHDLVTGGKVIRGPKVGRLQPYYLPGQVETLEEE